MYPDDEDALEKGHKDFQETIERPLRAPAPPGADDKDTLEGRRKKAPPKQAPKVKR